METEWQVFKWTAFIFPALIVLQISNELFVSPFFPGILLELAAVSFNVWMIHRMINVSYCASASFLGVIRCWLAPISLSAGIILHCALMLAYTSVGRFDWVAFNLIELSIMCITWYLFPEFASIIFVSLSAQVVVLIVETVADEIIALKHRHDQAPTIRLPAETYWELVTILKTSNNGYNAKQFFVAKICDLNKYDDPFWPGHNSLLCVVEVRRRNSIWKTITIWQVSLLNGGKKKMHEFKYISYKTDGRIFDRRVFGGSPPIKAFQSSGVIFICISDSPPKLFVYDMRFRKSATYEFIDDGRYQVSSLISMTCARRFISTDGKVEGWQMRLLEEGEKTCTCPHHNGNNLRSVIQAITYELREKASVMCGDEVTFGQCREHFDGRRHVRTSDGSFGLHIVETPIDSSSVTYNSGTRKFLYFPSFRTLLHYDRPFATYFQTHSPRNPLRTGYGYSGLCPAILSPSECIKCHKDGAIFRTKFKPSTLRYLAARQLFRDQPHLRHEISAEEFQQLTGIDMEGHFDQ